MGIMTMARGTIAGTIATTTVGKEEPGAIRAFSLPGLRRQGCIPGGLLHVLSPVCMHGELACSQYLG
jgi:hypothetical protein